MKFFTFIMLLFLPPMAVTSVYGTQFFSTQKNERGEAQFVVNPAVENIASFAVPLTLILLGISYMKYQASEERFRKRRALRKRKINQKTRSSSNSTAA